MTGAGDPYARTGRYLGISDGYFLYDSQPNWVYCYCQPCWQAEILKLPFVGNSRHQLATLQEQHTALQNEFNALKDESTACREQLSVVTDELNKFKDGSTLEQLRNLLKQLTTTQVEMIERQTSFRISEFENQHIEQQKQCSQRFVSSTASQLKVNIDEILSSQTDLLSRRRKAKESVLQILSDAGANDSIITQSVKPLENEIIEIEAGIAAWRTFVTSLDTCISR